ncbi:MAG: ATP-binding cassette domain-containing protein [Candidatus Hodarchaeota archaeon]
MSKNICIEFRNISKKYKDLLALNDVSFTINKGDVFGYIGPNGAGKTTTIKILVGLITEFSGKVYIYGKDIQKDHKDLHKLIGYHPQEAGFQEWRTVDHAFKTFGRLSGLDSDYLENRTEEILKLIGLSDFRYKKIVHLSGGMVQKLRLGQALLHEPEILIMDEPLSGLDPQMRYQFKEIIKKLAKSGITILFSSHILSDVQDIANNIGILSKGQIMKIGSPEELQTSFHIGNILEIVVAKNTPLCDNLEEISGVVSIENFNNTRQLVHLNSDFDIDLILNNVLRKITEQQCRIRSFKLLRPSLEEVYLKYVGGETT